MSDATIGTALTALLAFSKASLTTPRAKTGSVTGSSWASGGRLGVVVVELAGVVGCNVILELVARPESQLAIGALAHVCHAVQCRAASEGGAGGSASPQIPTGRRYGRAVAMQPKRWGALACEIRCKAWQIPLSPLCRQGSRRGARPGSGRKASASGVTW